MNNNQYIVAAVGTWNKENFCSLSRNLHGSWFFVDNPEDLTDLLRKVDPKYIFFPHWRWIVPAIILNKYECVCFHMTDVPYGKGGSPLQNLIVRGHKKTVLTALRMTEELDAGPIYAKEPLDLSGNAEAIYRRASLLTWDVIAEIIESEPKPKVQIGESVSFSRRKPEHSVIPRGLSLEQIYDYIRMLDAPGYPKACLELDDYYIEFEAASLSDNAVIAKAVVKIKPKDH